MTDTEKMIRVEIVSGIETTRRWFTNPHHAEEYLMEYARLTLGGSLPASGEAASERLLDDDSIAWCSTDEVSAVEVAACPRCDCQGGWSAGYCEPCGYQFGEDPEGDE
jgi:hypothetical protein